MKSQIEEKTFKQGVDEFIGCAPSGGWSDYWAMQQDWEFYKDSLCRDGRITQRQADSWGNPCTPETFNRWQKRNGLVRRGYESKKSEGISDMIDAKIDYNMFMRMCKTAAYLEEDEDYWDALWEYYSDLGSIGDALVFFDNLFQYTSWKTAEDLWTDYSNILGDKPEGKDYEEALDAYLDENDNEVGNSAVYKYGDHYLMLH